MPNAQLEQPAPKWSPHLSDEQYIVSSVLAQLGHPRNLYRASAERVWDNQYRVNLWCTEESDHPVKKVKMTDSFFVTLTDDGVQSTPAIARKYT